MICTAAGAAFSSALKRRCAGLRTLVTLIGEMTSKIRYRAIPLPDLIEEMSGESGYAECAFLRRVNVGIGNGGTVQSSWVEAARTVPFLSETDREILSDLGNRLGDSDIDGQLSVLGLAGEMLKGQLESAESECAVKSHSAMRICLLFGLGTGIVII